MFFQGCPPSLQYFTGNWLRCKSNSRQCSKDRSSCAAGRDHAGSMDNCQASSVFQGDGECHYSQVLSCVVIYYSCDVVLEDYHSSSREARSTAGQLCSSEAKL